jgi:hypothetical protein
LASLKDDEILTKISAFGLGFILAVVQTNLRSHLHSLGWADKDTEEKKKQPQSQSQSKPPSHQDQSSQQPSRQQQHPSSPLIPSLTTSPPSHPSSQKPPSQPINQHPSTSLPPIHPSIPSTHPQSPSHPPPHVVPPHTHPSEQEQEKNIVTRGIEDTLTPSQISTIKDPLHQKLIQAREQATSPIQKSLEEEKARTIIGGGHINTQPRYKPAVNDPAVKKIAQRYNVTPDKIVSKLTGSPSTAAQIETMTAEPSRYPELHGGHNWVESKYPHTNADGMVTNVKVKDDFGPKILPTGTTSIFSVGYISKTGEPNKEGILRARENETEIIYLATGGGQQKDIDTKDPHFIKSVSNSGGNMANQPITNGIYATVDGAPVQKLKLPIVKGHIIRDLENNKGTLYQVLDTTANTEDHFIDHSLKGKSSAPIKQLLNFDEWHVWRGENDPNQDIGPTARRFDIDVIDPPKYIKNNIDPTKSGTIIDAGNPVVAVRPRSSLSQPEFPDDPNFPTTTPKIIGQPTHVGWSRSFTRLTIV